MPVDEDVQVAVEVHVGADDIERPVGGLVERTSKQPVVHRESERRYEVAIVGLEAKVLTRDRFRSAPAEARVTLREACLPTVTSAVDFGFAVAKIVTVDEARAAQVGLPWC